MQPRLIRLRDAPNYLGMDRHRFNKEVRPFLSIIPIGKQGMDRHRFNKEVRPFLSIIPIGKQGIAFDRLDLDAWVEHYKQCNGRPNNTRSKKLWGEKEHQVSLTARDSLEEAEIYLAKRIEEIRQAKIYGVRPKRTFRQAAIKYVNEKQHKASINRDIYLIKQIDTFIGYLPLKSIHMGSFENYIKDQKLKNLKNRTINYGLQVVRHILNLAENEWKDNHGLSWLIKAPKIKLESQTDARKPYPLSFEEQINLFNELPIHLRRMALFAVNTGCRDQEICNLKWDWEIKVPEGSVFLIPPWRVKNREERLVILNRLAYQVIEEVRGIHSEYVFTFRGKPITRILNSAWKKARVRAGLPSIRVHDLKHTFGRRLRAAESLYFKKFKNRTINYGLQVVRHILNLAENEWKDNHGLSWLIKAPKIKLESQTDARKPYPLSFEEQINLFNELPIHLRRMALFAVNTGCRDQEICNLKWDWEIKVPEGSVFLIPPWRVKNREERLVILNRLAYQVIEEVRGIHSEYVFTFRGKPITRILNSAWKKARVRAGLPSIRVHDLKHTFGRRLRAAEVSFEDRQDLLGHKSGRITTHYSQAEYNNLIRASNKACNIGNQLVIFNRKETNASSRKSPVKDFLRVSKSSLIYNAFLEGNQGTIPLPPPQEVGRVSAPPEIIQTFTSSDATMQSILGSYDASLGINNNQLSGVAIVEGATQSNAAVPYLGDIVLKYRSEQLEMPISAGVNFSIQKSRALQQIITLMQASPLFAQFINTEGLPILLDNLEIRGTDQLKAQAETFTEQLKVQQQQQMNQPNPVQEKINLEKNKLAAELQRNQLQHAHKTMELGLTQQSIDTDRMKLMADQIITLMQASPLFAQFINTEGLPILLDNLEIRGTDQLKAQAETFTEQLKVQQQQQMNQPNPVQEKINLEKNKLAAELQRNQLQHAHKTMELGLTQQSIDTDRMKLMADVQMANAQHFVQLKKSQTETLSQRD
ncbi:hypothetical protein FQR65_LT05270 [Abscondita terminalis]|nr:hypothetical protein FQR65_LT05270 [Abscondita terminalis]